MLEGTLSGYIRNLGGLVGYQVGLGVRLGNAEPLSSKNLERKPTTASLDLSPPGSIRCRMRGGNDTASAANTQLCGNVIRQQLCAMYSNVMLARIHSRAVMARLHAS